MVTEAHGRLTAAERIDTQVFQDFARASAASVELALAEYLASVRPTHASAPLHATFEAVRSLALRGGKRWRAALAQLAYEAFASASPHTPATGKPLRGDPGVVAGVALELLQTYLLIHDDWMDQDDVRRGAPSVHVELGKCFPLLSRPTRPGAAPVPSRGVALGDAAAILAGDFACALAQSALLDAPVASTELVGALSVLARMQRDVVLGQTLDVLAPLPECDPWGHIEQVYTWKTGSYTVDGPLSLGAALGGATSAQLASLRAFAHPVGIAFQMADDLLGTFGDPAETGKSQGGDLREGKRTSIVAAMAEHPALHVYYAQLRFGHGLEADDASTCLRVLRELGVDRQVAARVERGCSDAVALLEPLGLAAATTQCLRGAVFSLARRKS
jgi:geranylgeranyl diphosphate synthase, type I